MILFFLTIFIFRFISYKKLKMNLLNMSKQLNGIESIEVKHMVNEKKNPIKKKMEKNKRIENARNINSINIYSVNENNDLRNINKIELINNQHKDFEKNQLEYEEALKLDKRNYFQYYISLLKYNHPIMFSIGIYNDYNSRIIKIFLFFFSFSSDLTINALFFNDDTMHKIYQDKGKFDLLYQIPQILYSALISRFIDTLIKNLALSQDNIIEFKQENGQSNLDVKYIRILNIIRYKIILFFVVVFVILSFFLYYITCFCGVYVNT